MKINVTKTPIYYVFGHPVTVNKTENIVFQGFDDEIFRILSPNGKNLKTRIVDGSVIVNPYEMICGTHILTSIDKKGRSTTIGTITITETKATVSMVDFKKALYMIADCLTTICNQTEENTKNIKKLIDQSKIDLG